MYVDSFLWVSTAPLQKQQPIIWILNNTVGQSDLKQIP